MRHILLLSSMLLLPALSLADGDVIQSFTAGGEGQTVLLEWSVRAGAPVVEFRVQRSFDNRRFYTIAEVEPTAGATSYSYIDDDLFKSELHTYYYRIEVLLPGSRSELSPTEEVTLSFSGIRRTWGSIKAMFR